MTSEPIAKIAAQLSRLPGIGVKSAQRLAYHIVSLPPEQVRELAVAIWEGRKSAKFCSVCGDITATDPCPLCADTRRRRDQICVVRDPRDIPSLEHMRGYKGLYHVLHGALSPIDGIGPSDIRIAELLERIKDGVSEVILATNPDVEGESTANYIAKLIRPTGVKVTRIAFGLPVGAELEYADDMSLSRAFEWRREM